MRQDHRESGRRWRRQQNSASKDRWMITYADLITLLLIFFVIMYGMSRLDTDKYELVTQSLQQTFSSGTNIVIDGNGILDGSKGLDAPKVPNANSKPTATGKSGQTEDDNPKPLSDRELAFRKQEEELQDLMDRIETYVKDNHLEDQINVADLPKGISITLSDRFLFDTGRADLKEGSTKTMAKLASLFKQLNTVISIEGHTDSQPIVRASKFKDNWELSGARALSVLRFFLDKENLDPEHFQYAGYADTRPAADNTTDEGRQKNRRVEITVLRQLQQ
jgi:chemotaxis protein MotB